MNRIVVILNENEDLSKLIDENISILSNSANFIYVASKEANETWNKTIGNATCMSLHYPTECDTMPKKRNWINKFFRQLKYDGILYVLEDNVKLNSSIVEFFSKLENMMNVLDYSVWFNTISDGCNYLYNKYMPRVEIHVDVEQFKSLGLSKILFTSHSNTALIAYDFSKVTDDLLTFNESFLIPMYYIIEYLARRRNNKTSGSLFFMNQYITIPEEYGIFTTVKNGNNLNIEQKQMQEEDAIFKNLKVNYSPDNNIDSILECTYLKLQSKVA